MRESNQSNRPFGVTLLATLQFFRAGTVLTAAAIVFFAAIPHPGLQRFTLAAAYVAGNGIQLPALLMPAVAIFQGAIGWGLWRLQRWARWVLMITSGVTAIRWLMGLMIRDWALGQTTLHTPLARNSVGALILLDVVIFFYLIQFTVREAFGET